MTSKRRNASHNTRLCICPDCKADHEAGKRMSDVINLYRSHIAWEELEHKWLAFRLQDGTSDAILYDSKRDAIRGQLHEFLCCYISYRNLVGGASPHECAIFLNFTRDAYDAGFRLPDPDDVHGGPEVAPTAAQIDSQRGRVRAVIDPAFRLMQGMN